MKRRCIECQSVQLWIRGPAVILTLVLTWISGCSPADQQASVVSPDGKLRAQIEWSEGQLFYTLSLEERVLVERSELSILDDTPYRVVDTRRDSVRRNWKPVWGHFSTIQDNFEELTVQLEARDLELSLICRVFDDGVGFRFSFPPQSPLQGKTLYYRVEYNLDADYPLYHPRGPIAPVGPFPVSKFNPDDRGPSIPALARLGKDLPSALIPAVVELDRDLYLTMLESDLYSAVQQAETGTMELARGSRQPGLLSTNPATVKGSEYSTPWRVFLIGKQPGDMILNPVPLNLAAESKLEDASWVKPGKAMWDWMSREYETDGFTYGIDTASYKRLIDFGSRNNIRYLLLDWYWYTIKEGEFEVAPDVDIEEVISYGRERGVQLLLYWDEWRGGTLPMEQVFRLYSDLGAAGVKYGFKGNDAAFTAEAITRAAEHRLLIDFHDKVTPMIGVHRTLPNAITREYGHAQQDAGRVSSPGDFVQTALINMITGPVDLNYGFYALNTDPETSTRRAWILVVDSTVAAENAKVLICFNGLVVLPEPPEEFQKKIDFFEFIARMPQEGWDETRILKSEMTRYLSMARRAGEEWFVGSVVDEEGEALELTLDFLEPDREYNVTYYEDARDSHYVRNKEAYRVRTGMVEAGDVVRARMAPGGGHTMWIRPR